MSNDPKSDEFEVKCPKCKKRVKVALREAEGKSSVRCSCGENIDLVKMI